MVMYFLQACNGFGLCAEALKYIPAGYNVGESLIIQHNICKKDIQPWNDFFPTPKNIYQGEGHSVKGIETTRSQLPLMKKGKAD